jgi:hypothetical protein
MTEIPENKESNLEILINLDKEISQKANEISQRADENGTFSLCAEDLKNEIELQNLPLYIPQEITAKRISALLGHTQNTQRWIGYVIRKNEKKFKAKLEDITNPGTFEIGTFDIDDAIDEKEMIQVGAIFYLSVGYNVFRGTRAKQKLIRFQRLIDWTTSDFDIAMDRANRLAINLKEE